MASLSNNEIRRIRSLSQKKFRDELGLFVVEGDKMVEEALASDFEVVAVYRRDEIGQAAMERVSALSSPSPSLAVVRQPRWSGKTLGGNVQENDNEIDVVPSGLVLGLDSLRDPGNLGTIVRTADWFGVRHIYATLDTAEIFNPKAVQATMGSIFRVAVHYCDLVGAADALRRRGGMVYGAFLGGESVYGAGFAEDLRHSPGAAMIVIGNEANGISPAMAALTDRRITIPVCPPETPGPLGTGGPLSGGRSAPESLNAATATAILLSEYRRQTFFAGGPDR